LDITHDQVARRFAGTSFRAVLYRRAAEKKMMDNLGLVAKSDEDTSGRPIYLTPATNDNQNKDDDDDKNSDSDDDRDIIDGEDK
jgi:hypothetical protein